MAIPGFGEIAEQLRRSTVLIHSGGRGSGSGVICSSNGVLVTNAHVVRSTRPAVQLWDGREFEASVQSRDPWRDLAELRIDAVNLPAASVADSSQVRPGELAIAIGNPMGFVGALATGVIHGVGPLRGLGSQNWVQAEVLLAPGNSGGPLADARGKIVGINTMVAGRLALAIPSNGARFSFGNSERRPPRRHSSSGVHPEPRFSCQNFRPCRSRSRTEKPGGPGISSARRYSAGQ